jgi:hypothetical protein
MSIKRYPNFELIHDINFPNDLNIDIDSHQFIDSISYSRFWYDLEKYLSKIFKPIIYDPVNISNLEHDIIRFLSNKKMCGDLVFNEFHNKWSYYSKKEIGDE